MTTEEEIKTIEKALAKAKAFDIIKDKAAAFELWKGNVLYIRCSAEWATNLYLDDDEAEILKEVLK